MTTGSPTRLGRLLEAGKLAELTRETQRRRELADEIRKKLPAAEAEHVVAASLAPTGELTLVVDSAAWAARLRYRAEDLGVPRLRVKVLPGR